MSEVNSERLMKLFQAMRFPLIVLVLFIHVLPNKYEHVPIPNSLESFYIFVSELVSHNLGRIAVPMFYVISGFLFFYSGNNGKTPRFYIDKWKRRINTLVIPYLLWNAIFFIAVIIKNAVFNKYGIGHDEWLDTIKTIGLYGVIWGMPLDYPLWYLRDLICMTLLTPVICLFIRKTGLWGIVLLYIVYLFGLELPLTGFSTTAILYFSAGCFLELNKVQLISVVREYGCNALFAAIVFLFIGVLLNDCACHETVMKLFIPIGLLSFCYVIDGIYGSRLFRVFISLSGTVFFVYAVHAVYIINWSKGLFVHLLGDGAECMWLSYFFVPILVLCVSLGLYRVLSLLFPRTLSLLCGNRM